MSDTTMYADGYGRWHAIVKDTPLGLTRAVEAIASALSERGWDGMHANLKYVNRNICTYQVQDKPGYVHFIEYEIETDVA